MNSKAILDLDRNSRVRRVSALGQGGQIRADVPTLGEEIGHQRNLLGACRHELVHCFFHRGVSEFHMGMGDDELVLGSRANERGELSKLRVGRRESAAVVDEEKRFSDHDARS